MKKSELIKIVKEEIQNIREDAKDERRVADIIRKGKGNENDMAMLAHTMANRITNVIKASERAKASARQLGSDHVVTKIFKDRAKALGFDMDHVSKSNVSGNVMYLPTWSALEIWENEIKGQISDGAWENARPYDHWKVWSDMKGAKGSPKVQSNRYISKRNYNLGSILPVVGDRMLAKGRLAKALGRVLTMKEGYDVEDLPEVEPTGKIKTKLGPNKVKKFYKTDYSIRDLKNDLNYIKKAMTTGR